MHSAQRVKKYNQENFTAARLQKLQQFVLDFCDKKIARPDKKADLIPLQNLKKIAVELNLSADNLLSELSRLLHAVQHFINQTTTDQRRLSYSELINFLQKVCDKIKECETTDLTSISCALNNLREHLDYSNEDILKRRKWGFAHASELQASPHLLAYWLSAARQIKIDVAVPDKHLSRCTHSILRYIGGLQTGCEVVHINTAPDNPEELKNLPLHFERAFLRHANKLYFYDKKAGTVTDLRPHENDLDHIDHVLCVTNNEVMPVTPEMLKTITELTLFSSHLCEDRLVDYKQGIEFFSPRNILVALMDGVFDYFEARIDFQSEMIDVLTIILKNGIYEDILRSIANYLDDSHYGDIRPSELFLESLMRIGYASNAKELKAIREKCHPVMDARGIELDKADVEAIINHTPGKPDSSSQRHSRQPSDQGITCAPTTNKKPAQSEKPVTLRKSLEKPKDKEEDSNTSAIAGTGICNTADLMQQLQQQAPSAEAPKRRKSLSDAELDEIFTPAHERWKSWQRVLFAVVIGVAVSAILVGVAAALLYAGPLAHVALAVGVTATVHWAAAVGVAGVVGTLAGLPVLGAAVGFFAGLFWNRKTVKEMKQFEPSYTPQDQLPTTQQTQGVHRKLSSGFLGDRRNTKRRDDTLNPESHSSTAVLSH